MPSDDAIEAVDTVVLSIREFICTEFYSPDDVARKAIAAYEALPEQVELRRDAERYRHIREFGSDGLLFTDSYGERQLETGTSLDASVDAAIARKEGDDGNQE